MINALPQMFSLEGKCALITGGSRGLGFQIAEAIGEAGATVFLTSRKAADLEEATARLTARGIAAHWFAADAGDAAQVPELVRTALDKLGTIDVLVNNAGATWGAPAEEYPLEAWDKVMGLNVRAPFLLTQTVGRQIMIPRRSGRIINVASVAGLGGNVPEMTTIAYNTSKAALINFTRALACEWGRFGITVNALAPGFFPSKMSQGLLDKRGKGSVAGNAPLNRLGDEEDLKGAALLFAARAGKHITGQTLAVDGGVSCVIG